MEVVDPMFGKHIMEDIFPSLPVHGMFFFVTFVHSGPDGRQKFAINQENQRRGRWRRY